MKITHTNTMLRGMGLIGAGLLLLMALASCAVLQQGMDSTEGLPGDFILVWHREGGIAGFCDDVTIASTTTAVVSSCRSGSAEPVGEVELTADEQAALADWLDTYTTDDYDSTDPATADAMTITIEFYGHGSTPLEEADWDLISQFAQSLVVRAGR